MKTNKNIYIAIFSILFTVNNIFAGVSPISLKVMSEIQNYYSEDRAKLFLDRYLNDLGISEDEQEVVLHQVNTFIGSSYMLKLGSKYLYRYFSYKELNEIYDILKSGDLENDDLESVGSKKILKLIDRVEPYINSYLRDRVVR